MVNGTDVIPDSEWLTLPDVAERTGVRITVVKQWLQERELVAVRRGPNNAPMVPADFLLEDGPVPALKGTLSVLADGGFSDAEIIDWLHRPDDTLVGGSAIASLREGSKTEVRRRAQEIAF